MNTEQITYLDDIARTHSISQTAQRFFISQQALSFSLTKLEEEFGVALLERTNHGTDLTKEGRLFLEKSKPLLDTYRELKDELFLHTASLPAEDMIPDGTLTIYSHSRILEPLLVNLLEQYTCKYPQVSIQLFETENIASIEAIAQSKGDLGLIFIPDFLIAEETTYKMPESILLEQLFSDEFVVCCSCNHPLRNKKALKMNALSNTPVILFDTNSAILAPKDKPLPPVSAHQYHSTNMAFHKAMIRRGLAVSLITSFEFRKLYFKHKDITALPIIDSPKSIINLVTNTVKTLTPAARTFINMLKKYDFYSL